MIPALIGEASKTEVIIGEASETEVIIQAAEPLVQLLCIK